MDPFTAIGLASAIITFIEFGSKVANRLEELSNAGDLPKVFRDIQTRLPLILGIVTRTQEEHQDLPWAAKEALSTVVKSCFEQVELLHKILDKLAVADGDSKWTKGLKAASSLVEENRVQRIASALSENVQLLMALNVSYTEKKAPLERRFTEAPPPTYAQSYGAFILPFERDSHFIGRDAELAEIDTIFTNQSRASVAGIGGVGKSQVAIEYAYRFKDNHPDAHIFWVYGGTIARFYQGYKRIAQKIDDIVGWDDPDASILELVSQWFRETTHPFLLILDNADNVEHFWPARSQNEAPSINLSLYLPESTGGTGKLLVTTRDSRIGTRLQKSGKPIVLSPMNAKEAKLLFLANVENEYTGDEEQALDTLVRSLDFLPLASKIPGENRSKLILRAVTQAASFIDENNISIAEYVDVLENEDVEEFLHEELNDSRRDEESVNSVFRTWKVSYDYISKQKPKAIELLCLMSVLDRQSIPRWLIKVPEAVTSIGLLTSFHMVTIRAGSNAVQIHRLVQLFVQTSMRRAGTLQKWKDSALACVSKVYPTEIGLEEWPTCDALAPHVQILTRYEYKSVEARLDLAHLLCWAADFDIERGFYMQALNRAKRSLDIYKELVPGNDNRLASSTWLYGRLLYYESKSEADMEDAADILRQALAISEYQSLNYAETAFELAHVYYAQSKEKDCLEMGKASFECWKSMEGDRSIRTLDNMHDYSLELAMFGYIEEAIAQWQTILDHCPKSEASENTKTVYKYRSLASIAEFQNDAQLAEMLYTQLIELCSGLYSAEHVHVFDYRLSHAEQILRQGRTTEAMQLCEDMLKSCNNKSEWRIKLSCYEMMAECYEMNKDYEKEETHRLKCLELQRHNLGDRHIEVVSAAEALARCFLCQGKALKAEPLLNQALQVRRTPQNLEYLGICKSLQGLDNEAATIFSQMIKETPEPRLLDHLCTSFWNQQKWIELEAVCRQALEIESDYRLGAHWMLITALEKQNKITQALEMRAESLQIEDKNHDSAELRRVPKLPYQYSLPDPRFGRIIHPRSWSA